MIAETDKQAQEQMVTIQCQTRIDLLWGSLTDQDKINFAEYIKDAAAMVRRGEAHVD